MKGEEDVFEDIENVNKMPNEIFPSFLFTPIRNIFEKDSYDKEFDEEDPAFKRSRMIRSKRRDVKKYLEDVEAYNEYMNYLVNKHRGDPLLLQAIMENNPEELNLPNKPKLRKIEGGNYRLIKKGIMPSLREAPPDFEGIDYINQKLEKSMGLDKLSDERIPYDPNEKMSKKDRKEFNRILEMARQKDRILGLYDRTEIGESTLDVIKGYLNSLNTGSFRSEEINNKSIKQLIKEERRQQIIDTIGDDSIFELPTYKFNYGGMISKNKSHDNEIVKELYTTTGLVGLFDPMLSNKHMDKSAVKMTMKQLGITEPLTKKDRKKMKKKAKQRERIMAKNRESNAELSNILTRNRIDMENLNDMTSLSLSDILRERNVFD